MILCGVGAVGGLLLCALVVGLLLLPVFCCWFWCLLGFVNIWHDTLRCWCSGWPVAVCVGRGPAVIASVLFVVLVWVFWFSVVYVSKIVNIQGCCVHQLREGPDRRDQSIG